MTSECAGESEPFRRSAGGRAVPDRRPGRGGDRRGDAGDRAQAPSPVPQHHRRRPPPIASPPATHHPDGPRGGPHRDAGAGLDDSARVERARGPAGRSGRRGHRGPRAQQPPPPGVQRALPGPGFAGRAPAAPPLDSRTALPHPLPDQLLQGRLGLLPQPRAARGARPGATTTWSSRRASARDR
jgi:hypothetical protein